MKRPRGCPSFQIPILNLVSFSVLCFFLCIWKATGGTVGPFIIFFLSFFLSFFLFFFLSFFFLPACLPVRGSHPGLPVLRAPLRRGGGVGHLRAGRARHPAGGDAGR